MLEKETSLRKLEKVQIQLLFHHSEKILLIPLQSDYFMFFFCVCGMFCHMEYMILFSDLFLLEFIKHLVCFQCYPVLNHASEALCTLIFVYISDLFSLNRFSKVEFPQKLNKVSFSKVLHKIAHFATPCKH